MITSIKSFDLSWEQKDLQNVKLEVRICLMRLKIASDFGGQDFEIFTQEANIWERLECF